MSPEQAVFTIAALGCAVGAVTAATHRDPRVAGAALLLTLVSLAVLYAGLAAPLIAAVVLAVSLIVTLPVIVHHTIAAPHAEPPGGAGTVAALLVGVALLALVGLAIARGEVPVNVSLRSADGYDVAGLRELLGGRGAVAAGAVVLVFASAVIGARAGRRVRAR